MSWVFKTCRFCHRFLWGMGMGWEFHTPQKPVPVAWVLGYLHRDPSHAWSPTWSPTTSDRQQQLPTATTMATAQRQWRATLTTTTTILTHATTTMPQDKQHDRKCAMGRMMRAGEGPSCPPPIWYVFSSSQCGGEGYSPPCCVFAVSMQQGGAYTPPRLVIPLSAWQGGACPLPIVSLSHFWYVGEGYTPPRCVFAVSMLFLFRHGREGHAPSPLCLCLIFDVSGRGIPLLVAFCYFDVMRRAIPFSLCRSHFNTARRGMPPPHCVIISISTWWGGMCPPCCVFVLLLTGNKGSAPRCIIYKYMIYNVWYPQKPIPVPTKNPYPWPWVRVSTGMGTGTGFSEIPQGYPWHSLVTGSTHWSPVQIEQ